MANEASRAYEDRGRGLQAQSRRVGGDTKAWADLLARGRVRSYRRGMRLVREGEVPNGFHVLMSGQAKARSITEDGRARIHALYAAGDVIGLNSAVSGEPARSSAIALSATETCLVQIDALYALVTDQPTLAGSLLHEVLSRSSASHSPQGCDSPASRAETRFAQLFLRLLQRPDGESHRVIPLQLSRQDLAEMLGTTTETASRIMSAWRRKHLVTTFDRGFVIHDEAALRRIALG